MQPQARGPSLPIQRIFLIQGLNPGLPHCKQDTLLSEPPGKSEDARNAYQIPTRIKDKQTVMNNTLEGNNSRITEAEEWINNLEDRWWKSLHRTEYRKKNEKK